MIEHFDAVLVDRAVNEPTAPPVLSRAERRAAGRRLLARGMSTRAVADRLDVTTRTAWRWSAELRTPASAANVPARNPASDRWRDSKETR